MSNLTARDFYVRQSSLRLAVHCSLTTIFIVSLDAIRSDSQQGELAIYTQDWSGMHPKASEWKKYRLTTHTHNPVDDAKGNAEALKKLKELGLKI